MSGSTCAFTRDLAWFCAARGKLPLFGGPRLLAMGISGRRILGKNGEANLTSAQQSTPLCFLVFKSLVLGKHPVSTTEGPRRSSAGLAAAFLELLA